MKPKATKIIQGHTLRKVKTRDKTTCERTTRTHGNRLERFHNPANAMPQQPRSEETRAIYKILLSAFTCGVDTGLAYNDTSTLVRLWTRKLAMALRHIY